LKAPVSIFIIIITITIIHIIVTPNRSISLHVYSFDPR
jgi:hypothetical protein